MILELLGADNYIENEMDLYDNLGSNNDQSRTMHQQSVNNKYVDPMKTTIKKTIDENGYILPTDSNSNYTLYDHIRRHSLDAYVTPVESQYNNYDQVRRSISSSYI